MSVGKARTYAAALGCTECHGDWQLESRAGDACHDPGPRRHTWMHTLSSHYAHTRTSFLSRCVSSLPSFKCAAPWRRHGRCRRCILVVVSAHKPGGVVLCASHVTRDSLVNHRSTGRLTSELRCRRGVWSGDCVDDSEGCTCWMGSTMCARPGVCCC